MIEMTHDHLTEWEKKVFNKIQHPFLTKTLRKLGIKLNFLH